MKTSLNLASSILTSLVLVLVGCSGDDGKNGTDGIDGTNGTNGTNGMDGADGEPGPAGDDGVDGMDGMDGMDGTDGADGDAGVDGDPGAPGTSGIIDRSMLTGDFVVYTLAEQNSSGIDGVVRFAEFMDGSTLVTVLVSGTTNGIHPAHIHVNSIAHGAQPAAVTLNSVDGLTGVADTVVTALADNTPITYDELIVFNGYVNVHTSPTVGTPVCGGDIGGNALTGTSRVYPLTELASSNIMGTATLAERVNGFSLLTIEVTGTVNGVDHPAHIHAGAASSGGAAIVNLNNVVGATGRSTTDIRARNDLTPLTYANLLVENAYINVHESTTVATPVAEGNIGSNAP
jgi:hypothetical protein